MKENHEGQDDMMVFNKVVNREPALQVLGCLNDRLQALFSRKSRGRKAQQRPKKENETEYEEPGRADGKNIPYSIESIRRSPLLIGIIANTLNIVSPSCCSRNVLRH